MKIPKRLQPLLEDGLIDEVVGRLMSGKEADVFIVRCGGETRCAKVYKEAIKRGFKQAVTYQEGRKVRNTRRARAMEKGSKFGRQQQEETWQTAEVDALKLLASVGVRVPVPYSCVDGVLLMEMIVDAEGLVAPRLSEVVMTEAEALRDHEVMMRYVVLMLCAGVVHGDLSEFNVLVDPNGPVIIDLPQAVDAAGNNHAESMLARDVNNITGYYGLYAPALLETKYAKEIWGLYEAGELEPGTPLTGVFAESDELADVDAVLAEIDAVQMEQLERLERQREAEADYD